MNDHKEALPILADASDKYGEMFFIIFDLIALNDGGHKEIFINFQTLLNDDSSNLKLMSEMLERVPRDQRLPAIYLACSFLQNSVSTTLALERINSIPLEYMVDLLTVIREIPPSQISPAMFEALNHLFSTTTDVVALKDCILKMIENKYDEDVIFKASSFRDRFDSSIKAIQTIRLIPPEKRTAEFFDKVNVIINDDNFPFLLNLITEQTTPELLGEFSKWFDSIFLTDNEGKREFQRLMAELPVKGRTAIIDVLIPFLNNSASYVQIIKFLRTFTEAIFLFL